MKRKGREPKPVGAGQRRPCEVVQAARTLIAAIGPVRAAEFLRVVDELGVDDVHDIMLDVASEPREPAVPIGSLRIHIRGRRSVKGDLQQLIDRMSRNTDAHVVTDPGVQRFIDASNRSRTGEQFVGHVTRSR